jgi:hypothetical protein
LSCSALIDNHQKDILNLQFNETDVLKELDQAFNNMPSKYFPTGKQGDTRYNFFLDLEHGYCVTAGNKIHLYADSTRWAVVFEKSGYNNRGLSAQIELNYIGNCINYPIEQYPEGNSITNTSRIILIDGEELKRIENKVGHGLETFELISNHVKQITVREKIVPFDNNYKDYEKVGIKVRDFQNPRKLIGFDDFVRYLNETNPTILSATESDIQENIPKDLPKLMTLDKFHFSSVYDKSNLPSGQETFQLIAKVLVTRDTMNWKPTLRPNNHWSNWESGNL